MVNRIRIVLPRSTTVVTETIVREVPFAGETDTQGRPVPVNGPHTFTYDDSGNLKTDTVSGPSGTWVRTYTWTNGAQTADSGWVKNG